MLASISEFFKDVKDRVSNPLISSFIISWLCYNWRIPITLLFYRPENLVADNYISYVEALENYLNQDSIGVPLVFAFAYTLWFPKLKAWIKLKNAKIISKNESDILVATQADQISMKRYIKLKDDFRKQNEKLLEAIADKEAQEAELIVEQTKTRDSESKARTLELQISSLDSQISSLQGEILNLNMDKENVERMQQLAQTLPRIEDKWEAFNNGSLLYGAWDVFTPQMGESPEINAIFDISAQGVSINGFPPIKFEFVMGNINTSEIAFGIIYLPAPEFNITAFYLHITENPDILFGMIGFKAGITFKRRYPAKS